MAGGTAFADILDEMIGEVPADRASRAPQPGLRPLPPNPFLFTEPHRHYRTAYGAFGRPGGALRDTRPGESASVVVPPAAPAPSRPPMRKLSFVDARAVEQLVALGARLPNDFTAGELRSAFRALARKYHPDTHPASDPAESARLARVFADVNAHYQQLQRTLDTPA
jgi:hypothetical protein